MNDDLAAARADDFAETILPADTFAPTRARRLVCQQWPDLDEDMLADVELIVTELVANAVRHGQPDIILRTRRKQFGIDIGVLDHGPGQPQLQSVDSNSTSGRGLALINTLARCWGCDPLPNGNGKIVWASIHPNEE